MSREDSEESWVSKLASIVMDKITTVDRKRHDSEEVTPIKVGTINDKGTRYSKLSHIWVRNKDE